VYDYWAVEYGYKPIEAGSPEEELGELEKIAARCSEPKLAYGTDEDAFGYTFQGIDPLTNLWDYGPDPIEFYHERCDLTDELLANMERSFAKSGSRYQKMRLVFDRAMRQYARAGGTVAKYLGGLHLRRDRMGDPGERLPFEPVSSHDQRRALEFLNTRIFGREAFQLSPTLVSKLAPERYQDFDWSLYYLTRLDYPVHTRVLAIQEAALRRLYHPITLNRMVDFPLHRDVDRDLVTMHEMFEVLTATIWSEVKEGASIDSFRRNLQRAHLDRLLALVVKPRGAPYHSAASGREPAGHVMPPEDARSFARANLVALGESIESALRKSGLDAATRAHLDESHARIQAALEARVERGM
jgi:hypothetical protein